MIADIRAALIVTEEKANVEQDRDKKDMYTKLLDKVKHALETPLDSGELIEQSSDVLSTWLDKLEGHNIKDNSIFNKLPRYFEGEFHKDMAALNVIIKLN